MIKLFLLFLIVIFLCTSSSLACDYYVATNGNDSWDGTTPAYVSGTTGPWLTLQKAADTISGGDEVCIRGGVYTAGAGSFILTDKDGTAEDYTTFTNYESETPILEGCSEVTGWSLHSGSVYKATWDAGTNLDSGSDGYTVKSSGFVNVDKVIDSDNWLEPWEDLVDIEAGGWYYDQSGNLLYVWLTDSSNPSGHNIYSVSDVYYDASPILITRSDYTRIENITIRLATFSIKLSTDQVVHDVIFDNITTYGVRSGFVPGRGSYDITFQNSEVYNTQGVGIQINADYVTVQNNKIHDTGSIAPWVIGNKGWGAQGIIVSLGEYNVVTKNDIYDTLTTGVYLEAWGIEGAGQEYGHHTTVNYNYIYHSAPNGYPAIKIVGADYAGITNNIIYNYEHGVFVADGGSGGGMLADQKISKYNKIYNNTIVGCDVSGVRITDSGMVENLEIKNNIFYENLTEIYVSDADLMNDFTIDYNLYNPSGDIGRSGDGSTHSTIASWRTELDGHSTPGGDDNSIEDNPDFTNPASDWTLQSGSPAQDAGAILGAPYDDCLATTSDPADWVNTVTTVPQGVLWNIGAYGTLELIRGVSIQ